MHTETNADLDERCKRVLTDGVWICTKGNHVPENEAPTLNECQILCMTIVELRDVPSRAEASLILPLSFADSAAIDPITQATVWRSVCPLLSLICTASLGMQLRESANLNKAGLNIFILAKSAATSNRSSKAVS